MTTQKLKGIFCIIIAVVALGFSIACFEWENDGYSPDKEFYGGDAYTGIQHAVADTARNVQMLISSVAVFAGFAFVLTCLAFLFKGITCLRKAVDESTLERMNSGRRLPMKKYKEWKYML